MNGYLVLLCHTMDDLPVRFFATHFAACRFAQSLSGEPDKAIRDLFNTDCSTPVCVKVVEFRDGAPLAMDLVKEFEVEEP